MVHAHQIQRCELADTIQQIGPDRAVIHQGAGVYAPVEIGPSAVEGAQVGVALQHGIGVPPADHVTAFSYLHIGWHSVWHRILVSRICHPPRHGKWTASSWVTLLRFHRAISLQPGFVSTPESVSLPKT